MAKANPKVADTNEQSPALVVEDTQPAQPEPAKPVKVETREVNGIAMTFEDY